MTIQPRDILFPALKIKPLPPKRFSEDDSLLVEIRDKIAKAENIPSLRGPLRTLLGETLLQMDQEDAARAGLVGILHPEIV